jgi:hypothetical protein
MLDLGRQVELLAVAEQSAKMSVVYSLVSPVSRRRAKFKKVLYLVGSSWMARIYDRA